jgi:peroxiredoxin
VPAWLAERMTQLARAIFAPIVRSWLHPTHTAILLAVGLAMAPVHAIPRHSSLLNKPAPALARTSLDHQTVDLAALRGRVVLLNFWATWCASCLVEMPRFAEWESKYRADGLTVIGVSMDDDSDPAAAMAHKLRLNYPVVMGDEHLGLQYGGVLGLPVTYLIDRQGLIRARFQGGSHVEAIETSIRKLLSRQ